VTSATAPFSVFTPTSSDAYSSYCSRKYYKLYDSSGSNDAFNANPGKIDNKETNKKSA
jgi:hypothetical protein